MEPSSVSILALKVKNPTLSSPCNKSFADVILRVIRSHAALVALQNPWSIQDFLSRFNFQSHVMQSRNVNSII